MTEVFYTVLKASFQGSIVILAVMLLRLLLKKAPKSLFCLLWLLAGLRLVLPFEIQSSLSLQPQLKTPEISIQAEQPVQTPDILIQNPEGQPLEVPAQTPNLPEGEWEDTRNESLLYGSEEDDTTEPIRYGDIAAGVWGLGMAVMFAASAVSYFRLKRRVREAYLIESGCFECPGLDTAFVLGFFPPKIYLPMGLSDREKKFIFDHENTHIARHDQWFKLLGYVVLSIHWFNPLAWLAYHLLCRDMELACDEHVVKYMSLPERKAYSAALLSCGSRTARFSACPVAFGESNPKKRILNVLNYKRPSFWISLLAVIAVIFVSVCLLTSPAEEQPPEETNTHLWNLELQVTNVTPFGLTVEFIQQGPFEGYDRAELHFGSYYTLQRLENGQWADVEMLPQEYEVGWTSEAYIIKRDDTTRQSIDWEWLYGELPGGRYRIGKDVDLFRGTGDWDSEMLWAEFTIEEAKQPAWNMDMTEEECMAWCSKAVEKLQGREQFHISETLAYFTGETEDSRSDVVFWRDGENWLRQSYVTRMRENRNYLYYDGIYYVQRQKEGEEAVWDLMDSADPARDGNPWLCWLRWDNQPVVFNGAEQEGEELRVSVTVHATPPTLGWDDVREYNILFFFDKAGNMTQAIMAANRDNIKVIDDLKIETTLGSNIHSKLEEYAAQRPLEICEGLPLAGETYLEKCRTALEDYQSQGTWAIKVENSFKGEGVLNSSSASLWYGCGKDYLKWAQIPDDGGAAVWWDLQVDGASYHCNGYFFEDGTEDWKSQWEEGSTNSQPVSPPWPLWYDWKDFDIEFVEQGTEDSADYVTFTVQGGPFPAHTSDIGEYRVTFWFRYDVLHFIELSYSKTDSWGEAADTRKVFDLYFLAPKDVENKINQCYSEALLHVHGICNDPECTDTTHDHYGIACTVEHCTNPAHGHGDGHHD